MVFIGRGKILYLIVHNERTNNDFFPFPTYNNAIKIENIKISVLLISTLIHFLQRSDMGSVWKLFLRNNFKRYSFVKINGSLISIG
ncbi:MAG: hypothetical protein ACRCVW_02435 [Brevinema sp.]